MVIVTKRLRLRQPESKDVETILKIHNSEFVLRYNAMKKYTKADMLKDIETQKNRTLYLELRESKEIIGAIFINPDILRYQVKAVNLSYYLGEEFQNCGYMFEALEALITKLFENNIDVISARVFVENIASKRLLEKLGFSLEGCLRHAIKGYCGTIHDDLLFSLIRENSQFL